MAAGASHDCASCLRSSRNQNSSSYTFRSYLGIISFSLLLWLSFGCSGLFSPCWLWPWPCDMFWLMECGWKDTVPVLSFKRPCMVSFFFVPWKRHGSGLLPCQLLWHLLLFLDYLIRGAKYLLFKSNMNKSVVNVNRADDAGLITQDTYREKCCSGWPPFLITVD